MTIAEREASHLQVLADSLHITVEQLVRMGHGEAYKDAFNAA